MMQTEYRFRICWYEGDTAKERVIAIDALSVDHAEIKIIERYKNVEHLEYVFLGVGA